MLEHHIKQIKMQYQRAQQLNQRLMLVFLGTQGLELIQSLFIDHKDLQPSLPVGDILTLGLTTSNLDAHIFTKLWPKRHYQHLSWSDAKVRLGGTEAALLVDLNEGLDPDALSANLGVIKGGGLIIFIAPDQPPQQAMLKDKLRVWPQQNSEVGVRFWTRIWESFNDPKYFIKINPNLYLSQIEEASASETQVSKSQVSKPNKDYFAQLKATQFLAKQNFEQVLSLSQQACVNHEQSQAVAQILFSYQRQAFSAVALNAYRGRGKSSVLGIAAACLSLLGEREIYVTAPNQYACAVLFERAVACLRQAQQAPELNEGELIALCGSIKYVTPLELWTRRVQPKCLFVDEAATLPLPLLERLLETKPNLVFATTTHGYEGTGRGFSLRFRPLLQKRLRKLYEPKLHLPIRWTQGDQVEAWVMQSFLLEAQLRLNSAQDLLNTAPVYRQVSQDELAQRPALYEQVFALLINAHYRTQPSDLWRLLDAPNLGLHLLLSTKDLEQATVLAAAIVSTEGNLSAELSAKLYEGRERPRGQLFAANLAIHLNCEEGARLKLKRIVRIATQPIIQSKGLGSCLLQEIAQACSVEGVDLLGSSFGATDALVRFWSKNNFKPLRISVRQSHVSGERSLLVAQGLSQQGKGLLQILLPALRQELDEQLLTAARDITPELVFHLYTQLSRLLKQEESPLTDEQLKPKLYNLSEREWKALGAVAFSGRAYELATGPARYLALAWMNKHSQYSLSPQTLNPLGQLLIMKVVQAQGWLEVTRNLGLGSTSEAMKGLSAALRLLYFDLAPSWAKEWVKRFPQYEQPATLCHALLPNTLSDFPNQLT